MFNRFLLVAAVMGVLALLVAATVNALAQGPAPVVEQGQAADRSDPGMSAEESGYNQVIPPADFGEVMQRANERSARAARETARVQSVIDYIKTNNRFPPKVKPFDAAQQVVMDFIRLRNRVPTSAAEVNPPVQAVIDYMSVNHAMPPHPQPVDPAIQAVMDYIRIYGKVPTSAGSVQ